MTRGGNAYKDEETRTAGSVGEILLSRAGSLGVESASGPWARAAPRETTVYWGNEQSKLTKMKKEHCPICSTELEVWDVSPCWDCGHHPAELDHLASGLHTYSEFEVLGSRIVLCDFCMVDFSSYDAELFGLPKGTAIRLGCPEFKELGSVEHAGLSKDKVCPACDRRLKFLNWVMEVRECDPSR